MAEHPDDRVQDIPTDTNRLDRLIARQIAYSVAEACSCRLFFGYDKVLSVEFAVCRVASDVLLHRNRNYGAFGIVVIYAARAFVLCTSGDR